MPKVILTGNRPTGSLHAGHYAASLKGRTALQNSGIYNKIFIMAADARALTDNTKQPKKVRQNMIEAVPDYLSCGLAPDSMRQGGIL